MTRREAYNWFLSSKKAVQNRGDRRRLAGRAVKAGCRRRKIRRRGEKKRAIKEEPCCWIGD
jgi:hypothetical protein